MQSRTGTSAILFVLAALLIQGCSASIVPGETGAATTGTAPPILPPAQTAPPPPAAAEDSGTMASIKAMLPKGEQIVGTPTELYTRIARGALTCWFGASGPLKSTYMYHAEAAPPSQGGRSEIIIRIKDKDAADPRSLRAYRVTIAAGETGSVLETENVKIPEPLATSLGADVRRWAADDEGCSAAPASGDWSAGAKPPAAEKSPKTAKKSNKAADK